MEHPFLTLKCIWGFAKVRYRGLVKNANRTFAMLALINIDKWGKPLGAVGGQVRPKCPVSGESSLKGQKAARETSKIHETSTAKH